MKFFGAIFVLVNAMVISAVAIYVSIYGMIALFAAHALAVGVMIGSIEIGKLSAATWLKFNWNNKAVGVAHKAYLLAAVLVVSVLTGIGTFGFLSAGHLEQNAPLAGLGIQSQQYQTRLDQTTATNRRVEARLAQIDQNINTFLEAGSASKGLRASTALQEERNKLASELATNNQIINDLNTKLAPLQQQSSEVEAKLGPVKYLASAMGYDDPEVAVNLVILLIMLAFDPLAVVLIISAMATLKQISDEKNQPTIPEPTIPEPEIVLEPTPEPVGSIAMAINPNMTAVIEPIAEAPTEPLTAPPIAGRFLTGDIPIEVTTEALAASHARLTPAQIADMMASKGPPVDDPKEIRNLLLDLMEQYPDIVNDLIDAAKEIEPPFHPTISNITGATVDR